ncbi:MAG: 30S ribosomal protein S17 [Candidatus Saccharibacteria bacterium]|nr:30S ribosomal protein S17 [Candidatus Saccharibacteria bacterium]
MARTLTGVVTSAKADKTITVTVTSRETHPIYKKQYTVSRKYAAHDENNEAGAGDTVMIAETRPISKTKTWELKKIIEKARDAVELRDEVAENFAEEVQAEEEK